MYTLASSYYMEKAIFREDTFYLIPGGAYSQTPRLFHWCPELAKRSQDDVGIIFFEDHAEDMKCDRCKKKPGDDISTIFTLLRET